MSNLKKLVILTVALLSCLFLTACEPSFEETCETTLGGKYYSKTKSSYEYAYSPSQGKFAWVWVHTKVETCIKDGKIIEQDVTVS